MQERGVFAVHRGIWDHAFFEREPFTQREAWLWLIGAAAWKPISVGMCGKVVPIERGEFCFSLRFLAEKFGWLKDKVARFLLRCTKHDMMRATERDSIKVYKIVKYNDYQIVGLPKRDSEHDASHDATATAPRHDRDKEETFKHSNIESDDEARASAKALTGRICEILRVDLQADPERITWQRQVEEMLRDGLTDSAIIAATEVARTRGNTKLSYIRAIAFSPPKPPATASPGAIPVDAVGERLQAKWKAEEAEENEQKRRLSEGATANASGVRSAFARSQN